MQTNTIAAQIFDAIEFAANECKIARGANKTQVIRQPNPLKALVILTYKNPKREFSFVVEVVKMTT